MPPDPYDPMVHSGQNQKEKHRGNKPDDANNQGGSGLSMIDDIDYALQQQVNGLISPGDPDQFGDLFDDTSLIAEDDESLLRLVTDDTNAAHDTSFREEDAAEFHETDWAQIGNTIDRCTDNEFEGDRVGFDVGAPSPFPHQQVEPQLDTSFTADDARMGSHGFADQGLNGTINQGVCEVFAQFQASAGDVYQDATTGTQGLALSSYHQGVNHMLPEFNAPTITLSQWIEMEKIRSSQNTNASITRKLNVAYGIGKLLQASATSEDCTVRNFTVGEGSGNDAGWEVAGIHMMTPALSVHLVSDSARINEDMPPHHESSGIELQKKEGMAGRDVSAIVVDAQSRVQDESYHHGPDEMKSCFAFGELIHFLFSGDKAPRQEFEDVSITDDYKDVQPAKKQSRETSFSQVSINSGASYFDAINCHRVENASSKFRPLTYYGCPFSISQLVEHLLSCGDKLFRPDNAFKSLKEAIDEILLLLKEPIKFLFRGTQQGKLAFRAGDKLFGLSAEISKIQDAYHRASTGRNEAVIISGFSG